MCKTSNDHFWRSCHQKGSINIRLVRVESCVSAEHFVLSRPLPQTLITRVSNEKVQHFTLPKWKGGRADFIPATKEKEDVTFFYQTSTGFTHTAHALSAKNTTY